MKKRLILLLSMLLAAVPVYAEAPEYTYYEDMRFIDTYSGVGGDVVIPDNIDGKTVEGLYASVLYGKGEITSVTLPETAEVLGASNIYMMPDITKMTMPENLEVIGAYNFYGCPQLTELTVPAKVTLIGKYCFAECDNLKSIRFNGVVPVFGANCFSNLPEDCVVYVPEDQLQAYQEALPSGLNIQSTGENAVVYDYTALEADFEFDAATGTVVSYLGDARRVDIPATIGGTAVTAIGESAFIRNSNFYYVTIPEGVTTIGDEAFLQAFNFEYAKLPSTLESIGEYAFYGYCGTSLELPENMTSIGAGAFASTNITSMNIPEGITAIEKDTFEYTAIEDVYIPESVESIAEEAFEGSYIDYVCFEGKDLPEIAGTAFLDTEISDVDLNWQASKAQMMEAQAFFDGLGQSARVWRMQNPNADFVRDGLDSYENGVMLGYTGEQTHISMWYTYDDIQVTALADGAFKGNTVIEYFVVPYSDEFTTIGAEAFADSSVQVVDMFDSVTTIGDGAFRNCVNMTELTIPESVTSIGAGILEGCSGLKKVVVMCDPSVLPEDIFSGCTSLEEVWANPQATPDQAKVLSDMMGFRVLPLGMERPEPVAEEGIPYVGVWNGSTMEADGMTMEMSDIGMSLGITFYEDGFADLYEDGMPETVTWSVIDGAADISGMMQLKLDEYGRLYMDEDGAVMYFLKEGVEYHLEEETEAQTEAAEENADMPELVPVGEEGAPFFGVWNGTTMEMEGQEMDMTMIGMNMVLTFYENGMVEMYDGESSEEAPWSVVNGAADIAGMMQVSIKEDGRLCMDSGDGVYMYFVQGEAAEVSGTPETEAANVSAEAPAAGDAEFAGIWTSDTGTLELKADGTCVLTWPDGSSMEMTWEETAEGATITSGNWWGCVMVLEDANTLNIDEGWVVMTREGGAAEGAAGETDATELTGTIADYIGTWHCAYLSAGPMEGDPRTLFGLNISLVLNEDGTGTIDYPEQADGIWYEGEYNYMYFGQGEDSADSEDSVDMPMKIINGGFLQYGTELAGYLVFSKDPEAVWTPDMLAAETEAAAVQTPVTSMPGTSSGAAVAAGEMEERLDTKFVAANADVGGFVMEASMLGGEFSVTFHSDGTLTLIMVGAEAPGLTWTQGTVETENGEADAFIVNYYNTNTLEFVATEAGFDLNYFDSMLLHFVPEA